MFITTNQLHNNIVNAALRITVLINPSMLPIRYIGIKICVAGSKTVKVSTALAPTRNIVSTNSQ